MTKQMIEVDIPDGYKFVRFGQVVTDEHWVTGDSVSVWVCRLPSGSNQIIVRPIEKWRVPTKFDLLNRDSIECRVRDTEESNWKIMKLLAIISAEKFQYLCDDDYIWEFCEIRDIEPKPLELWGKKLDGRPIHQTYCTKNEAIKDCWNADTKVVHFVELQQ